MQYFWFNAMKRVSYYFPFIMVLFIISLISVFYVHFEDNIYYWDYLNYYAKAFQLNTLYHSHPLKALGKIFSSIWKSDYNYFPAIIPSLFIMSIGNHRQIYIQSIIFIYYVPFCVFFTYIFSRTFNISKLNKLLIPFIIVATNSAIIGVVLRGFPDVGGMVFIECAIILALSVDYSKRVNIKKSVLLGLCLWGAFLFRRWYAYTIVSLYISLPIFNYFYFNTRSNYKNIINECKNIFISGFSSVFMLLVFQFGLLKKIFRTNYSIIYSAYQKPLYESIYNVLIEFGFYLLPFLFLGFIFIWREKNRNIKLYLYFCTFNLMFSIFLFFRTQSPDMQHIIPFSFWMMMIAAYGLLRLFHNFQRGQILQVTLCAFFSTMLIISLFFNWPYRIPVLRGILPMKLAPLHIDSYKVYKNLVDDLYYNYKPYGTIAILSSSPVLNTSMIENISNYHLHIDDIAHVDLRDSGNWFALNAKYVVVVSPIQTHLPIAYQHMVTLPAYEILNHVGVGENYKKTGKCYELRLNVNACIYEKIAQFSQNEISDFNQKIYHYYPDWEKRHLGYTK